MDTMDTLREQVASNPIILYERVAPGASVRLQRPNGAAPAACGQPFAYVDVLSRLEVRQTCPSLGLAHLSPTLARELVGGRDIVTEMYSSGELGRWWRRQPRRGGRGGVAPGPMKKTRLRPGFLCPRKGPSCVCP